MSLFDSNRYLTRTALYWVYGIPFTEGNKITLLWKNNELFHNIFEIIGKAKELICLEFYIFRNDETGNELAEILKQKRELLRQIRIKKVPTT